MSDKVYANGDHGFVGWEGQAIRVNAGDEYDLDHPFVQANPHMFTGAQPAGTETPTPPRKRGSRRG